MRSFFTPEKAIAFDPKKWAEWLTQVFTSIFRVELTPTRRTEKWRGIEGTQQCAIALNRPKSAFVAYPVLTFTNVKPDAPSFTLDTGTSSHAIEAVSSQRVLMDANGSLLSPAERWIRQNHRSITYTHARKHSYSECTVVHVDAINLDSAHSNWTQAQAQALATPLVYER